MYQYILFDLDGTLTDPKVGICTSVQYALGKMGIVEEDIDKLEPFIGPPLIDSFMEFYGMSEEKAREAIEIYRERFSTIGKFENEVYPGIPELLRDLKKKGRTVAIASSKPTVFVEDILKHFEIRDYFDIVVGSELDGTRDKKEDVIKEVLAQMFPEGEPDYDEVVMVGDRKFDIEAAFSIGVRNIGVSYGYGSREELEEAGADKIVNTVEGLRSTLIPMMGMASSTASSRNGNSSYGNKTEGGQNGGQGNGQVKAGNGGSNTDWKTQSKEAGKQSFANMWGVFGPALIYWIGKRAISYMLLILAIQVFFKNALAGYETMADLPREIADKVNLTVYVIDALSHLLVGLFVIKDFKSLMNARIREGRPKNVDKREVGILAVASAVLAAGLAGVATTAAQMMADTSAQLAEAGEAVADAATEAASLTTVEYVLPLWIGIIISGILIPIAQESIFVGICYNRAKRYMKTMPLLICVLLFSFIHATTGGGLYLTILIGVSMYIFDKTKNIFLSTAIYSGCNIILYVGQNTAISELLTKGPVPALLSALGFATVVFMAMRDKLNAKKEMPEA